MTQSAKAENAAAAARKTGVIDVHCHLTDESEYEKAGGVAAAIDAAKEAGVDTLIVSGFNAESSLAAARLAKLCDGVYFCAGLQPEELKSCEENAAKYQTALKTVRRLLGEEKCVALGEIGLDYHFADNPSKEFQREAFVAQIRMADEAGVPVVIHSRDACADTLAILRENRGLLNRGFLMHCYSYSAESAAEFAALGGYFSFGGVATFKNAEKVKRAAAAIPRDRVLTETDSPYLAPEPYRGTFPNTPANVVRVAEVLADLRGESFENFCACVRENAARLFKKLKF